MNEQLEYIAQLLEQIRLILSRSGAGASVAQGVALGTQEVRVVNTPIPVSLTSSVSAELEQPLSVEVVNAGSASQYLAVRLTDGSSFYTASSAAGEFPIQSAVVNAGSSGNNQLVAAPGTGYKIKLVALALFCADATTFRLRSGGTDRTGDMRVSATQPVLLANRDGLLECAENQALNLYLAAVPISPITGFITYRVVAV